MRVVRDSSTSLGMTQRVDRARNGESGRGRVLIFKHLSEPKGEGRRQRQAPSALPSRVPGFPRHTQSLGASRRKARSRER